MSTAEQFRQSVIEALFGESRLGNHHGYVRIQEPRLVENVNELAHVALDKARQSFARPLALAPTQLLQDELDVGSSLVALVGPATHRKSTAAQLAMDLLARVAPRVLVLNGVGSLEGLMERMAQAEPDQPPDALERGRAGIAPEERPA